MRHNPIYTSATRRLFSLLLLTQVVLSVTEVAAETRRYRLSWREDPATSMVVGWESVSGSGATVYYGTDSSLGTDWTAYPNSRSYDVSRSSMGMLHQHARLSGLQPDTDYYFVVRDSDSVSPRFIFRTAPDTKKAFSVVAGGDSRNNRLPRQNANRIVSKIRPLFVAFGGDYTDRNTNLQWADWLDDWQFTQSSDGRLYPIVAARGNHDDNVSVNIIFDTPNSSNYFAFSFADNLLRSYTLNTEIAAGGSQGTWLENDLSGLGADADFRMAQYHKPMRPHTAGKSEGTDEYNSWAHRFHQFNMDLVVESDTHMVKRTFPLRPTSEPGSDEGFIRDDSTGTYYIGEGCWGAPLRAADDGKEWTMAMGSFNQCNWIQVHPDRLEVRTVKVENAADVVEVDDAAPFVEPDGIDLWDGNGTVLIIPLRNGTSTTDSITFQEGFDYSGTQDTFIRSASPDLSFGSSATIDVDGDDAGGPMQGLLRFDQIFGEGLIPETATIHSASLEMEIVNAGNTINFNEMLIEWDEAASWNSLIDGVSMDGVEAASQALVASASGQIGLHVYDVTASVRAWANGEVNYGWVITSNADNGVDFLSSEGANPPKLTVAYTYEEAEPVLPASPTYAGNTSDGTIFNPGSELLLREAIFSPNGLYRLTLQGDGNLVLRNTATGSPIWSTGTHDTGANRFVIQSDGNLVLYDTVEGTAVWASNTVGSEFESLRLFDDGSLILFQDGANVWSVNDSGANDRDLLRSNFVIGEEMVPGRGIFSSNGAYNLKLQGDGNFVLYDRVNGGATWASNTHTTNADLLTMEDSGNVILLDSATGVVEWETGTEDIGANQLTVSDSGEVQVLASGLVVWSSN